MIVMPFTNFGWVIGFLGGAGLSLAAMKLLSPHPKVMSNADWFDLGMWCGCILSVIVLIAVTVVTHSHWKFVE